MQPYDALTETDLKTIQYYLEIYGSVHSAPISQVLRVWNKNKIKLFKAFGRKLRIEKQIFIPKDFVSMHRQLSIIYKDYVVYNQRDISYIQQNRDYLRHETHNEFITDVLYYWANQSYQTDELFILTRLFSMKNVSLGYIDTISEPGDFQFKSFKATIKNGMKTLKTIQKILKLTHYPHMELFEEWRNAVNCISIGNEIQAKLVLSIHPIDFMSMSDNECNWSSCMSWKHNGSYRAGTLEMMNSNLAIVAYLEAPQGFKMDISENESYAIPNKSWRSLFYVHKDILLSGKAYPYHNEELTFQVLDILRDLVKENLNWNYQFGIQEYQDMKHLDGNFYVRDFFDLDYDKKKDHHCIFVYTNGMYNDIIESHSPAYFCYRNYVPRSIKLCLSGPATCICCGRVIKNRIDIYDYGDLGGYLVCDDCNYNRCRSCGNIHYHVKYNTRYGRFCSDKCCSNYVYFPKFDRAILKDELIEDYNALHMIFAYDLTRNQCEEIMDEFQRCNDKYEVLDLMLNIKSKYKDKVKVKRISEKVSDFYFLNLKQRDATYSGRSYVSKCRLFIYRYDPLASIFNARFKKIESQLDDLKDRISLLDYLKGGGSSQDESSFALKQPN